MVELGEFGDKEDIRIAALVMVLLIPIVGVFLLADAFIRESSSDYYSTTEAAIGILLLAIGAILLFFTIRWVRKK